MLLYNITLVTILEANTIELKKKYQRVAVTGDSVTLTPLADKIQSNRVSNYSVAANGYFDEAILTLSNSESVIRITLRNPRPANPPPTPAPTPLPTATPEPTEAPTAEPTLEPTEGPTASPAPSFDHAMLAELDGCMVSVSYGTDAAIPDTASLALRPVPQEAYSGYLAQAALALGCGEEELLSLRLMDISLEDGGRPTAPQAPVRLTVTLPAPPSPDAEVHVLHFGDPTQDLPAQTQGESVTFWTEGFSVFGVAEKTIEKYVQASDGTPTRLLSLTPMPPESQMEPIWRFWKFFPLKKRRMAATLIRNMPRRSGTRWAGPAEALLI